VRNVCLSAGVNRCWFSSAFSKYSDGEFQHERNRSCYDLAAKATFNCQRHLLGSWNKTGNVRKRNTEARSRNHCCRGKAMSITYSYSAFVACYPASSARAPYCHLWPQVASKGKPKFLVQNTVKQAISASVRFLSKRHFATHSKKVRASRNELNILCRKRVLF
jgi:hypothetical protein